MSFVLYRIETSGIKNLKETIKIDFQPQTVGKKDRHKNSNVKAIYGTNGAGKSGFINAVDIYKRIVTEQNYLQQNDIILKLNKLFNKITKTFNFNIIYADDFDIEVAKIFQHKISIKLENGIPFISYESMSILKDKTINGVYDELYKINNGELEFCNEKSEISDLILEKTKNILKYSTLTSMLSEKEILMKISKKFNEQKNDEKEKLSNFFNLPRAIYALIVNKIFANNITVFLDKMDMHNEQGLSDLEDIYLFFNKHKEFLDNRININEEIVPKTKISQYRKNVKKLFKFLLIFKPDLKDIRLEEKEDETCIHCFKKMVYDKYEIDSDYESTGIQKLMKIFSSIEDVTKEKIVFIDELDANINGVYLNKLIEYLNEIKKGQLCFTTHNLYPMNYLYKYSNSIDFIGETGELVSWVKNGNYRPYKQYPEGMIENSPFNIDAFDFVNVFESEEEKQCN